MSFIKYLYEETLKGMCMNNLIIDWSTTNFKNLISVIKKILNEKLSYKIFHILLNDGWTVYHDLEKGYIEDITISMVNKRCYFNGILYNTGNSKYMFKIPQEFCPTISKELMCFTDNGFDTITVRKTGECIFNNKTKTRMVNLNSTSFLKGV